MVDYDFYADVYLGSLIPEKAFPEMAMRAGEHLARIQRNYRVTAAGSDSLHMAICAMAETLYAHAKRRGGVAAASAGEVSVRYETGESAGKSLKRELYEKASIYLEISRGVGA